MTAEVSSTGPSHSTAILRSPHRRRSDVSVSVSGTGAGLLLAMADGSAGSGPGAPLASLALERIAERMPGHAPADDPWHAVTLLRELDAEANARLPDTEGSVLVASFLDGSVSGGSAGEIEAWLLGSGSEPMELTRPQVRRPYVGTGISCPVPFGPAEAPGALVVAGNAVFWSVVTPARAEILLSGSTAGEAAGLLADEAAKRLGSSAASDTAVAVVRLGAARPDDRL
jgi:hypothetical protein